MKYIKPYRIFEADDNFQTVKDICLDLEDDGYSIDIKKKDGKSNIYILTIQKDDDSVFKVSDIDSTLVRIGDYLGEDLMFLYHNGVSYDQKSINYVKIQFYSKVESLFEFAYSWNTPIDDKVLHTYVTLSPIKTGMKHIKPHNKISESYQGEFKIIYGNNFIFGISTDLSDEIKDYTSDLRDNGFNIAFFSDDYKKGSMEHIKQIIYMNKISDNNQYTGFTYNEVKPDIDRIIHMLSDRFRCKVERDFKDGEVIECRIILYHK